MSTGPTPPSAPHPEGAQDADPAADHPLAALHRLLERREDLRGAYAPADLWSDAVRWSA